MINHSFQVNSIASRIIRFQPFSAQQSQFCLVYVVWCAARLLLTHHTEAKILHMHTTQKVTVSQLWWRIAKILDRGRTAPATNIIFLSFSGAAYFSIYVNSHCQKSELIDTIFQFIPLILQRPRGCPALETGPAPNQASCHVIIFIHGQTCIFHGCQSDLRSQGSQM